MTADVRSIKKIAIVTMGVKLGNETKGYDRFKYLANMLVDHGFEVDLITSSFQHWEKKQRNTADPCYADEQFNVVFIDEPGYRKNVDLRRVKSHAIAAKNLTEHFKVHDDYDLIYSEIPPNDVALSCALFAEVKGIPYVCDVNDLWPEAMRMVLDVPVLSDILFHPLARDAKAVYSRCSAVVGTSDEYAQRPLKDAREGIEHVTVYVGNELASFDAEVDEYAGSIEKPDGEFWVTYAGTIGTSYDIRTMVLAAEELKRRGRSEIKMMILGGGPLKDELEELARSLDCRVDFLGYLPHGEMAAYLSKSDILVNSFVKKAPQSIVTKIGDYLAAAKPMINTCVSPEFKAKVEHDAFGINIEPEDPSILADAIEALEADPQLRSGMGVNARMIAETQFDRPKSYLKIEELINRLLSN
ncbi:glycosyltransferase family 4 protein [Arabiibacter massiliensis]|uniref:glycosyltransferase family 4 protein n=1 Tax=Arabiibacter massiliensis TaxID=1870985 RepID=UPI001E657C70|nr:glycosyltransferase family 4 protein [Arabiibacter massiliensis]